MDGTLAWPLEFAARTYGDRTAVIDADRVWTYHELHDRVRRIGAGLDGQCLSPGAPVGALLANSVELLELWLAVPAYGRVLVPLNTRLAVPELAFIVGDARISTLVVDAAHLQTGRWLREQCEALTFLVFAGRESARGTVSPSRRCIRRRGSHRLIWPVARPRR